MSLRSLILLSALAIPLLAGCASTGPSTPAAASQAGAQGTKLPELGGPEAGLKKGMPAEVVRRIMGSPAEIKPLQAPSGKAETWIYHRTVRGQVEQVQVGTRSTSISDIGGGASGLLSRSVDEPIMREQTQVFDVTVNLLLFNDTLIEQNKVVHGRIEYH